MCAPKEQFQPALRIVIVSKHHRGTITINSAITTEVEFTVALQDQGGSIRDSCRGLVKRCDTLHMRNTCEDDSASAELLVPDGHNKLLVQCAAYVALGHGLTNGPDNCVASFANGLVQQSPLQTAVPLAPLRSVKVYSLCGGDTPKYEMTFDDQTAGPNDQRLDWQNGVVDPLAYIPTLPHLQLCTLREQIQNATHIRAPVIRIELADIIDGEAHTP